MLTFNTWKSLAGVGDLAVKGRDMEEFGVVKGTKLLVGRQKTRNKKNFLGFCPSLKKKPNKPKNQEKTVYSDRAKFKVLWGKTWY